MADIHAWAPGQVLKLFRAGLPRFLGEHEARMTRAVFAAGGPAPEVLGEVTLDGRFGIVLPRLDGPTLLKLLLTDAITPEEAGAILATLCMSVHKTPPPPDVPALDTNIDAQLRLAGDKLPKHVAAGVLTLFERLPPADGVCHCDLHPANVIMTAEGPRLIDWWGAKRGGAALDLACSHVILSELAPDSFGDPKRQRAVDASMQSEYARQAGMSGAALTTAMRPYVSIIRVLVLL
ncbi:MAG TPA: aminoglycoside phosphotransferase family protein, partial [Caulobacteraceae bacterium]|nr:aminoglycoside phosphotransferase family protein [Caulobacteraceae bacterium]